MDEAERKAWDDAVATAPAEPSSERIPVPSDVVIAVQRELTSSEIPIGAVLIAALSGFIVGGIVSVLLLLYVVRV